MTSVFPSMAAFGGTSGLLSEKGAVDGSRNEDVKLGDLKSGNFRMVDTYIYDYKNITAGNPEPFAKINANNQVKIAVIGSGFAGVTAAYELSRAFLANNNQANMHRFLDIYEGNERAGGRVFSPTFKDGDNTYVNEMGAMRVPNNSKLFWNYLGEVGVTDDEIQPIFPNPGIVATDIYYRGIRYSWGPGQAFPIPADPANPDNVDWEKVHNGIRAFIGSLNFDGSSVGDISRILGQDAPLSDEDKAKVNGYWAEALKKYDSVSFISAVSEYVTKKPHCWGPTEFNMFATLGMGTGGFGPLFPVGFLEIFRLFIWDYQNEYSPSVPLQQIVHRFINKIYRGVPTDANPERHLKNFTVVYVGLDVTDNKPVVFYADEGSRVRFEKYDYVIVGTTLRSMQARMNLDSTVVPKEFQCLYRGRLVPAFGRGDDNMRREAMRIPHIMNSSKLFGLLKTKPWEDPKYRDKWPTFTRGKNKFPIKCVLTDTLARQMYFLDPANTKGSNVLISYNWGDDSVKIMGILNYDQSQVITPHSNPDFNLKTAYTLGISSALAGPNALEGNIISEVLGAEIPLRSPGTQHESLQSIVWQTEALSFGAFKIDFPEQYYYTSQMVYQYHDAKKDPTGRSARRIFVANNNCSFQGGWIEGAMQSGVNAAAAVLKVMNAQREARHLRDDVTSLFKNDPFAGVIEELAPKYELPQAEDVGSVEAAE